MTLPARRSVGLRPVPGFPGLAWAWAEEPDRPYYRDYRVLRDSAAEAAGTWGAADLEETEDAYLLEMDVPGVGKDTVNVDVTNHEIRVSGEVKQHEHTGLLHHHGRREGRFDQLVRLPGEADPAAAEATLADGVLTVRVPKAAADKPRKVEITAS